MWSHAGKINDTSSPDHFVPIVPTQKTSHQLLAMLKNVHKKNHKQMTVVQRFPKKQPVDKTINIDSPKKSSTTG